MSHRELRNLTEMLRALGYPHLVSMQSFRTPNFELVADVLHWLVARYDSSISVDDTIETEADRVHFLKATAQAMLLKGRIRLSLKNLYSANGLAVKELLKVASVLHDAQRGAAGAADGGGGDDEPAPAAGGAAKFGDLKATRSLAVDIVRHGARLHELLALHPESRELHAQALSRSVEVADVQRRLAAQAEGMAAQVEEMARMLANVSRDEASLSAKIDKRKAELERHEKRLASLSAVRPAFLDEYERLEGALGEQYEGYLRNWRNLQYLEGQLDGMHAAEQEGLQDQQRQMAQLQTGLREEELRLLRGDGQVGATRSTISRAAAAHRAPLRALPNTRRCPPPLPPSRRSTRPRSTSRRGSTGSRRAGARRAPRTPRAEPPRAAPPPPRTGTSAGRAARGCAGARPTAAAEPTRGSARRARAAGRGKAWGRARWSAR